MFHEEPPFPYLAAVSTAPLTLRVLASLHSPYQVPDRIVGWAHSGQAVGAPVAKFPRSQADETPLHTCTYQPSTRCYVVLRFPRMQENSPDIYRGSRKIFLQALEPDKMRP